MADKRSLDLESLLSLIREHEPYCRWSPTGKGRLGFGEYRDMENGNNPSVKLDALGLYDFQEHRAIKHIRELGRELEIPGCEERSAPERQKKEAIDEERRKAAETITRRLSNHEQWKASADILWKYFAIERGIPFPDKKAGLKFLHDELRATVQRYTHKTTKKEVIEIAIPLLGEGGELVQVMKIAVDENGKRVEGVEGGRGKKLKFAADRDRAIMFGPENASEAIVCEGIEDALSIRFGIAGAEQIRFFVSCGAASFGKVKKLVEDGKHVSKIAILDNDQEDESLLGSYALDMGFVRYLPKEKKSDANRALVSGGREGLRTWFESLEQVLWESVKSRVDEGDSEEEITAELDSLEFHRLQYPDTDSGAAKFFVKKFGDRIRRTEDGKFWAWRQRRWESNDSEEQIRLWVAALAPVYRRQAKKAGIETDAGKDLAAFAKSLGSSARQASVIACVRADRSIYCEVDHFDATPYLLNVQNGVLDLRTGELHPHSPKFMCSRIANVNWTPGARCPEFLKFLMQICLDDPELFLYKQRQFGYLASGYTNEKAIFFHLGVKGDNGKSVEADVLQWLLGSYAQTVSTELFMEQRFANETLYEMATLPGVRVIIASETDERKAWSEAIVKKMTGGSDRLNARHMRAKPFSFQPRFKPIIHGNNQPKTQTGDPAFWRRLHLIPYDFVATVPNLHLTELLKLEGEGILQMVYAGFRDWFANRLQPPARVTQARDEYHAEVFADVERFIALRCRIGDDLEEPAANLYEAYRSHCKERREHPKTANSFGRELSHLGFKILKKSTNFRLGISLIESIENSDDFGSFEDDGSN